MNKQPGYIYLIKAGEHYKIGKSTNVAQRIRQFNLPFPVEVVHIIAVSDMLWAEKHLHTRFTTQRVRGEWFLLAPKDVLWLCSLETLEPEPAPPVPEPPIQREIPHHDHQGDLLTTTEAAHYLGVTRQAIANAAKKGEIGQQVKTPGTRGGWIYMFTRAELDRWYRRARDLGGRPPKIDAVIPSPVIAGM